MNTKFAKLRGIVLLWVILFSFVPRANVAAWEGGDITMDTTLSGLVELNRDVRVMAGATLTILPGTTVRVISGDGANLGSDPALVEIIIENGYLAVDSATFEASFAGGWFGIHILSNGQAEITNSELRDCRYFAIWIDTTNQVIVSNNEIFNIYGGDGTEPFPDGGAAGGILIQNGSHIITGNLILDIHGGDGFQGFIEDPSDFGKSGGDGGSAFGIYISGGSSLIQDNLIYDIFGGHGGSGMDGIPGTDGSDGASAGQAGTDGSGGGSGGDGGQGGDAYGIYIWREADGVQVIGNEIDGIEGNVAGGGGSGGEGGSGGNGADGANGASVSSGGAGGNGGLGGDGGWGGDGGDAYGIYAFADDILCENNEISSISGGYGYYGGRGGAGGNGGAGGVGGQPTIGTGAPGGAGGNGGDAGQNGINGNGGYGVGIRLDSGSFGRFTRNSIQNIFSGRIYSLGGNGSGGSGGDGGRGGDANIVGNGGSGGAGGDGGTGTTGVVGGNSGMTTGLWLENLTGSALISNTIISGVKSGTGGRGYDGGDGGNGGNGGKGGDGDEKGPTGAGGDGGDGGNGGNGGDDGSARLVLLDGVSATLTNNTLVDPIPGVDGPGGYHGLKGLGGLGDPAGDDGLDGSDGTGGGFSASLCVVGISSSTIGVYNTIIRGNVVDVVWSFWCDISSTITSDYNDFYNVGYDPSVVGDHSMLNIDPKFVAYGIVRDFHLQSDSPCIDTGNNAAPGAPEDDFDGNPRPVDGDDVAGAVVDIGAYEYQIYSLTINTVGNGSVTKSPDKSSYGYMEEVVLTANADHGWTFSGWSGDASGTENPLTVDMKSNINITATFTPDEYTLTVVVSPESSGSVAKNPAQTTYHYGDLVELTANAAPGWKFEGWLGDLTGTTNPITVNITGDTTVTALFIEDENKIYLPLIAR